MKVLLIGNGGREHALAWKLAQSPRVTALYALPGNPGTAQFADNVPLDVMNFDKIEKFVKQNAIGMVVIGPEDPLAAGLADRILAMGVKVFGPTREGRGSKRTSGSRRKSCGISRFRLPRRVLSLIRQKRRNSSKPGMSPWS